LRPTCLRCLRPEPFCVCTSLVPVASRTRVVILQHPREARLAICSAWLTRIALVNAEIHRGVAFDQDGHLGADLRSPAAAVLFPGDGSTPVEARAGDPPPVLFAIDGTWGQAEKMLRRNPALAALPRLSVDAKRPSGYRELRREPGPVELSTIEAVALALGALEGNPARFAPMVEAFRRSVELQIQCARGERRRPRHRVSAAASDEERRPDHAGQPEAHVDEPRRHRLPADEQRRVRAHDSPPETVADAEPGGEQAGREENGDEQPVERVRSIEKGLQGGS
jgi:hypothetical protein